MGNRLCTKYKDFRKGQNVEQKGKRVDEMHTADMQCIKMSWNAFQIALFVLYKGRTEKTEMKGKG